MRCHWQSWWFKRELYGVRLFRSAVHSLPPPPGPHRGSRSGSEAAAATPGRRKLFCMRREFRREELPLVQRESGEELRSRPAARRQLAHPAGRLRELTTGHHPSTAEDSRLSKFGSGVAFTVRIELVQNHSGGRGVSKSRDSGLLFGRYTGTRVFQFM